MSSEEFQELKHSIETSGQREPIVAVGSQILDGKNRYKACCELNIPPLIRQYDPQKDGPSHAQFVADRNIHRRNLTTSQLAAIGAELTDTIRAERTVEETRRSRDIAADKVGVGHDTVQKAIKLKKSDPKKFDEVKAGKKTLEQGLREAEPQDEKRGQAADLFAVDHGDEFAEGVRAGKMLPGSHLREFTGMSNDEQREVLPLVLAGWRPTMALRFCRAEFSTEDTLRDILDFAEFKGGSCDMELEDYRIIIQAL